MMFIFLPYTLHCALLNLQLMHSNIFYSIRIYDKYATFSSHIMTLQVPRTRWNMTYFANALYYSIVPKNWGSKDMFSVYIIVQGEQRDVDSWIGHLTMMWNFKLCFCCHNRGYLSPEYASFGHISTAIDVYSFGIMILEIVSGRKNLDFEKPPDQQILVQWVWTNNLVSYNIGYWQILYVTYVCEQWWRRFHTQLQLNGVYNISFQTYGHKICYFFSLMENDQVHVILI